MRVGANSKMPKEKTYSTDIVLQELSRMNNFFVNVIQIIPSFDITNPELLPYGLKPHTRSVSWIVEQVIVQQAKFNREKLGIKDVNFDLPDTSLHDCIIEDIDQKKYYVNVKITNIKTKASKNDLSAVEKLFTQYTVNKKYRLIYVIVGFSFNNTKVTLSSETVQTFSPQFVPIYVNPRNDKIQAKFIHEPIIRSRKKFLSELKASSRSIVL